MEDFKGMPELKKYSLLISHSWKYNAQYQKIVNWLDNAEFFSWINNSVSADEPYIGLSNKELRERLSYRIQFCNAIIVVSGMYVVYSDWIDYEMSEAIRMDKPIIGLKPWGQERVPISIQENVTTMVGWNSDSLINAIRDYAL